MKLTPLSSKAARGSLLKAGARTRRAVLQCAKDPAPESVHEARVAVRKLRASISLMPQKYRKDPAVKKRIRGLREFATACAKLRDMDSMMAVLPVEMTTAPAKRRPLYVKEVNSLARRLGVFDLPVPPELNQKALAKRINRLAEELTREIRKLYSEASGDERKVVQLHKLRKKCRDLMYLLEYARPTTSTKQAEQRLEEVRKELGAIRDDDITIGYLDHAGASRRIISKLTQNRRSKYHSFVAGQTEESKKPRLLSTIGKLR